MTARKDVIFELTKEARIEQAAAYWRKVAARMKELKEEAEAAEDALISACNGENFEGYGVKVTLCSGRRTVDYKAIPELKGLDLAPYTKQGNDYWTIKASVVE